MASEHTVCCDFVFLQPVSSSANHYQIGSLHYPHALPQQLDNGFHLTGDHVGQSYGYPVPASSNFPISGYGVWPAEQFAAVDPRVLGTYPASISDSSTWLVDCSASFYQGSGQDYAVLNSFNVPSDGPGTWPTENFTTVSQTATNDIGKDTYAFASIDLRGDQAGGYPIHDYGIAQDWRTGFHAPDSIPGYGIYGHLPSNAYSIDASPAPPRFNYSKPQAASVNDAYGQYPMGQVSANPNAQPHAKAAISNNSNGQ